MEGNSQIKPIGGYFELADREVLRGNPHKDGILLNTGRNALEYILMSLGAVRKVYLPLYTCEVVLEPLKRLGIPWEFYHINRQLELAEKVNPTEGEYIVLNNYLGLKDQYVAKMATVYGEKLIVDCAQAFFAPVIEGIKCIYSTRKFVGVSDGGVAYPFNKNLNINKIPAGDSTNHSDHLFIRKEKGAEAGFSTYQVDEDFLNNQTLHRMSDFTKDILLNIDYCTVMRKRKKNYGMLEKALNGSNMFALPDSNSFTCPMAYPYLVENGAELRKKLIQNKIFVPMFWPNILEWTKDGEWENTIAKHTCFIPVDQRYGEPEMERILSLL